MNELEKFRREQEERELEKLDNPRAHSRILVKANKRVKTKKWYIVDMENPAKPLIIDHKFDNKFQAFRNIKEELNNNRIRYWVIKGKFFVGYRVHIARPAEYRLGLFFSKYEYPVECTTAQERKSYRTKLRYHKRLEKGEKGRLGK